MADIAQLERALINADKAGDTAAATALAGEIRRMRSQPAESVGAGGTAAQPRKPSMDAVDPPNWIERQLAKLPDIISPKTESQITGFVRGAAAPTVGAVQLAANAADVVAPGVADPINQAIAQKKTEYDAGKVASGRSGFDAMEFSGNMASPANLMIASRFPMAATTGRRILQGFGLGAAGGAAQPVEEGTGFWGNKAIQTGVGGVAGGVIAPVAGKVGDVAGRVMARKLQDPGVLGAKASMATDDAIRKAMKDLGAEFDNIPAAQQQALRQMVLDSMKQGKAIDAAAALRNADFEQLGIKPLRGQITRDATQFADERNLRSVRGVGEPIMQRLEDQNKTLQGIVGGYADGAQPAYPAGRQIMSSLQAADDAERAAIDALYSKARDHLGRAAPMDSHAFSTAANHSLDSEMLGAVLPAQARSILNDVTAGKIPFNVNTAVQIDQTLSRLQRGASDAEAYAIGKLRDALNSAPIADNVGMDAKAAFDAARAAARTRFGKLDAAPGLGAVARGEASPDDFVRKFLIGGKVSELQAMARALDPQSMNQARAQLGAELTQAAFGQNTAGDKLFRPEMFAKALKSIGDDKLRVFFSPGEIEQMHRAARVGSYINSFPTASPVSTSNSNPQGIAANLLGKGVDLIGIGALGRGIAGVAGKVASAAGEKGTAKAAMKAAVPIAKADFTTPEQRRLLAQFLSAGVVGGGLGLSPNGQ